MIIRRIKQPTPKRIKPIIGKPKVITTKDTILQATRKVTAKRTPSKIIEASKIRALALKKASTLKARKADVSARERRMKTVIKQTRFSPRKVTKKPPTNITIKLKETSIRTKAKLKSL